MLIQVVLLLAVVLLLLMFLRHHGTSTMAAGARVGFSLFMLFGALAVLLPGQVTAVANFLGVGRGTDLLLYGTVVAFVFATINTQLRFRELELRYVRLVRTVALQDSTPPENHDAKPASF